MATFRIGHASIDENGKTSGGKAGDQTGKEVCSRPWYNAGWHTVLRPLSPTLAEKSAKACEDGCNNNRIGYNQAARNSLHDWAKASGYVLSRVPACNCDCSSFMTVCAIAGGATELEYVGNAPTTSNMVAKFVASGKYRAITNSTVVRGYKYLKRGDILVKNGHTAMALDTGTSAESGVNCTVTVRLLKKGHQGHDVKMMQMMLVAAGYDTNGVDGIFGAGTDVAVKSFQKAKKLKVDGECGANTWRALING